MRKKHFLIAASLCISAPLLLLICCKGPQGDSSLPCDIYAAHGTPCVTAHSTTRMLSSSYDGPLYRVVRDSDGAYLDVTADSRGYAFSELQDEFCRDAVCRISIIYDQSGKGNDLTQAAPGTFNGPAKGNFNELPIADMAPVMLNGRKVYGVYIMPGMGFRCNNAKDLAINDEAEGIYYVIDGTHYDSGCCFDYGNSSTNGRAVGTGTMETTYYGTSTAWGRGNGEGPWIMSDMEAGLFTGYDAKLNDVPSIDGWRFVSVFVNGGDGNKWDLRGGNATTDSLTTYYSGIRPESEINDKYYPMHKKGGMLLGNGGDNGNGSAGTFYEGVMTVGYPTDEAINAVQASIAAASYREYPLKVSRIGQFSPESTAEVSVAITAASEMKSLRLKVELPKGWSCARKDGKFNLEQGNTRTEVFSITAPEGRSSGEARFIAEWKGGKAEITQRIRCSEPLKINEVQLSAEGGDTRSQFIELYNASSKESDLSGLTLIARHSGRESLPIYRVPEGTILAPGAFYTIHLAPVATTAAAKAGNREILLSGSIPSTSAITVNGSSYHITGSGTPAGAPTVVFIPVSTGPRMTIPAGSSNIPAASVSGFRVGDKMGIDLGGNYEVVTVTAVGTAATQSTIPSATRKGDTVFDMDATSSLRPGDILTISTGNRMETAVVKRVIKSVDAQAPRMPGMPFTKHEPGTVEIESGLQFDHIAGVDVSCTGSGISFEPATEFEHTSGDELRPLGTPYTLDRALESDVETFKGIALSGSDAALFGYGLSGAAGSIALVDPRTNTVIDALVYGSKQSNSSANGTIASPQLAVMESPQDGGGCIAVVPQRGRFFRQAGTPAPAVILARIHDGHDSDNLEADFRSTEKATPGEKNN